MRLNYARTCVCVNNTAMTRTISIMKNAIVLLNDFCLDWALYGSKGEKEKSKRKNAPSIYYER